MRIEVRFSQALNFHRIARFLSTVLVITLLQTVAGITAPSANAANACVLGTDYSKDTSSLPGFTILRFTKVGSCSFRNTEAITSIDYLIVGGGGGGGAHVGGGGGGGGVLQGSGYSVAGLGAIPITVGVGGTGAWVTTSWQSYGTNGGNSSLNGVTAFGGGVGGIWNTAAPGYVNGVVGSAGGAGYVYDYAGGTPGQGRAGGWGNNTQPHAAGGGGGAGQAGANGTQVDSGNGTGGKGGDGISVNITGTPTYFGGGGGGGVHGNNQAGVYTGGAGGLGGGGDGSSHSGNYNVTPRQPANYGESGTANTGGGGGGSGGGLTYVENKAGNGGSGIVIIKYANSATAVNSQDFAATTNASNYAYINNSGAINPGTTSTLTLQAWVKPSSTCDGAHYCTIMSIESTFLLDIYQGKLIYFIGSGSGYCDAGAGVSLASNAIPSGSWSHVALVRSGVNVKIYINGQLRSNRDSSCSPTTMTSNANYFMVGARANTTQFFYGSLDEIRIWSTDRSANIASDMHSNETSTAGLTNYWNFNEGAGLVAYNQVPTAPSENDLIVTAIGTWDSNVVSTSTTNGVYTIRTFYRSYITSAGGWMTPSGIRRVSAVVVAGGGGGGAESDDTGWMGGGGGAGGYQFSNVTINANSEIVTVKVGMGGREGQQVSRSAGAIDQPTNGTDSQFKSLISTGGGAGGISYSNANTNGAAGGSGGGGATYNGQGGSGISGQGNSGGSTTTCCAGGGGGGAGSVGGNGAPGSNVSQSVGGAAGDGVINPLYISGVSAQYLAAGGAGLGFTTAGSAGSKGGTAAFTRASANSGSGGGGGGSSSTQLDKNGGAGGSGIVIVRYITASLPTYTKPTNAYLNVGMTETFTTNVAVDSATVGLTRTFTWESSTTGAGGPFTLIKSGTGAANASFSWVPPDTSTSGSNYLYRLTVTDSDTAGLFITDSSTAFAVINPALRVTGLSAIPKAINLSKSETFTITLGTSTYRPTLSPVIPGITLDTSTAGFAIIKVSETMTVGTYYETLTVVDSVSASVVLPLTIKVHSPPQLTNTGEIVADGQVFNLDFSNSASYSPLSQAIADISGAKKTITAPNGGTFSNDFSGIYTLSSTSSQYLTATAFSMLPKWTIETYIRINATPTAQFCPFASEYASSSISMLLCVDAARTVFTGFFDRIGGVDKWSFKRSAETIPLNTWVHIVGTFDGSAANLYFDGVSTTRNSADGGRYDAGYVPPTPNTNRVFIGKDYPTAVGTTPNVSLGFVRAYNSGFTQTQVQQNFNATKTRFETLNQSQLKPSQKYGSLTLESFTATSGSDTKTVSFAIGNRTGITWDTASTPGVVKLSVQESLTVGTYYDTVTVTDNIGQSTYLPLTFTVTKADTITVTMNSPSTLSYTGSTASFTPTLSITGLKNSDTATASSVTITQTRAGNTCAMGGTCAIGDRGPGGGIVFITPSTVSGNGKYFEAAPDAWYGANDLSTVGKFCTSASNRDNTNENATQFGIGWGETNTAIFRVNCTGGAVKLATDYRGGGFSNWFVPNKNELAEMAKIPSTVDLINVTNYWGYWSSTEDGSGPASTMSSLTSSSWTMGAVSKSEATRNMVRPVRMFTACHSVDSCTAFSSTTMPTNAGTYRLTPSALSLSSGSLSNYQGVSYASGLLTINKVNQTPIKIGQYDAFPGISTYPLNVYGGAGTGVMRRTLTSAGTASCVLTNIMFITASTPGKCEVRVTKAADFNYNMETATATIYWIQFVDRYTNSGPTSPTDLALSGGTAVERRTYETFTVLSFADETGTAVTSIRANTKLRVIGTGFVAADGKTEVYFGLASVPHSGLTFNTLDPMANYVLLTVPADAETDRVLMYSNKGWATSPGTLTILP